MLMASVYSYAQLVEANENFKNGNYSKAKELYLVDYEKGKLDKYSLANLGFCYIAEYDYINAEKIFAEVVAIKRIEPEYHFYYAEILKINKKYSLAKQEFQKSSELFLQNSFILDQRLASCDSLMQWKNHSTDVIIENQTHLNSAGADFCAMRVGDKIIFVSEREINNQEAAWKPSF